MDLRSRASRPREPGDDQRIRPDDLSAGADRGLGAMGLTGAQLEPSALIAGGTRLVIIRHGEAVANAEEVIGGHKGCRGLTERGRTQARLLAGRLVRTGELDGAKALISSILPRSIETAEILRPALGGLEIESRCDVCERHPGEADGLSWMEYSRRYGRNSLPGDDPNLPLSKGGESWVDFLRRVEIALVDIAVNHPSGLAVIVAHGGVIDSSVIRFLGLPDEGTRVRLHPDHTSITEWSHGGEKWRLVRYNDAAHLREPAAAQARSRAPEWVMRDPRDK